MKIVVNTQNTELYDVFCKIGREENYQVIDAKLETQVFDNIEANDVDAYILSNDTLYFKRAVNLIKKNNPYVPILVIGSIILPNVQVDLCMNLHMPYETYVRMVYYNICTYIKTFATLRKLTSKINDKIEFANCVYDPSRRFLYHNGKHIKKLAPKEGGILEILATNFGEIVKKEVILEKVWHKTNDYFVQRSCDVYVTYLRNTLRHNDIKLSIKNITGIGLILEEDE